MLKTLKLFVAAAAIFLITPFAHAVTFTPSETNFLDFGKVAIGDSKSIMWNISWVLEDNESAAMLLSVISATDVYTVTYQACDDFNVSSKDGSCTFNVLFTPSKLGEVKADPLVQVDLGIGSYALKTTGEGISPVPLPAALPLLGGAVSLLGFFGWRRRRIAATRAQANN